MAGTKVAFIVDRLDLQEIMSIPILSAEAERAGHTTQLFEFNRFPRKNCAQIAAFQPDILAYSICSNEVDQYLRINRTLKKHLDCFSLFGGPHPTFFPNLVEADGVDAICRGEADLCFPEFLDQFRTGDVLGVSNFTIKMPDGTLNKRDPTDLVDNLDALPFPNRGQLYGLSHFMARNPIKTFTAGRGCSHSCAYCFNHSFNAMYRGKGRILRTKSVDYLLREIQDVGSRYRLGFVRFLDDIFGADRGWLVEFAERYPEKIGLPFSCYAHPNLITAKYSRLLGRAGCFWACIAIECANEFIRRTVANRHVSDEQSQPGAPYSRARVSRSPRSTWLDCRARPSRT